MTVQQMKPFERDHCGRCKHKTTRACHDCSRELIDDLKRQIAEVQADKKDWQDLALKQHHAMTKLLAVAEKLRPHVSHGEVARLKFVCKGLAVLLLDTGITAEELSEITGLTEFEIRAFSREVDAQGEVAKGGQ